MSDKPVTVRLSKSAVDKLMGLVILDGGNLAGQIRTAVDEYSDRRLKDPSLGAMVRDARKRQSDVLAALSASSDQASWSGGPESSGDSESPDEG
jgi:hypothetical protein